MSALPPPSILMRSAVTVTAPPLCALACHCRGCQRMSSSAFSLTLILPSSGLEVTKGTPVVGGLHGHDAQHMFCPQCMTWMFTRVPGAPEIVNLRPTMLDEHDWFTPYVETYTKTKLPWAQTGAVRSFEEFPPLDQYMALIQEYQSL